MDGYIKLTSGYTHLSLKVPLCWEHLNHTKDNQLNNTRKLGWVSYEKGQYIITFKIVIHVGQTESDDLGIYWVTPNGSSWLKFLVRTQLILLFILLVFCLFYKIVISYLTRCVTEPLIKIVMTRQLKMIGQIYSSI